MNHLAEFQERYETAKAAKTGASVPCAQCGANFVKTSYQQAFCTNKGASNCKDAYWSMMRAPAAVLVKRPSTPVRAFSPQEQQLEVSLQAHYSHLRPADGNVAAWALAVVEQITETHRTEKDFAIEHATYMDSAATSLLNDLNLLGKRRHDLEEDSPESSELLVEEAQCDVNESVATLKSRIHEFRKRARRCVANGYTVAADD